MLFRDKLHLPDQLETWSFKFEQAAEMDQTSSKRK